LKIREGDLMKGIATITGFALAGSVLLAGPSLAAGLACGKLGNLATPSAVADIDARLPKGFALEQSDQLAAAITLLREHGLSSGNTIDHLIAFYCPAVAAEAGLSDAEKRARVMRFAQKATRLVYAQNDVDAVIYDVPLKPGVAEAATERARKEGLTLEAWIGQMVEAAIR
jgi:hypothetical protein